MNKINLLGPYASGTNLFYKIATEIKCIDRKNNKVKPVIMKEDIYKHTFVKNDLINHCKKKQRYFVCCHVSPPM